MFEALPYFEGGSLFLAPNTVYKARKVHVAAGSNVIRVFLNRPFFVSE